MSNASSKLTTIKIELSDTNSSYLYHDFEQVTLTRYD